MEVSSRIQRKKLILSPIPSLIRAPNKIKGIAYLHLKVLQQLGVRTGGMVKIYAYHDGVETISKSSYGIAIAWPTAKLNDTQICLDAYAKENCGNDVGEWIEIEPVDEVHIVEASNLQITLPEGKQSPSSSDTLATIPKHLLEIIISQQLVGRQFISGNTVTASVYGKPYKFCISEISSSLALDTSRFTIEAYSVTPNTKCEVDMNITKETKPVSEEPPKLSYNSIGGLASQIEIIREAVEMAIQFPELLLQYGQKPPKGILLYGPPGTGKTLIARVIAQESGAKVFVINGPEFVSSNLGESEAKLRAVFEEAEQNSPSFIFIDELDVVCGKRDTGASEMEKRVTGTFLTLLDGVSANKDARVFVIGATNRPDSLDPALRRPGRFDREVEIGIPNAIGRKEILQVYLNKMPHNLTPQQIDHISSVTHGYVGADLTSLCKEAGIKTLKRVWVDQTKAPNLDLLIVNYDDVLEAMKEIRPSAMREVIIEVPKVYWSDIGGYEELKQKLREAIELPVKRPEVFVRMGIDPPRGLLLYGPPGCSKTLMAKALATEAGLNFIAVKGPELFSKWVGESERAVREVFRKARAAAPSIIFFDEIDALAGIRGGEGGDSNSGVGDRVVSQLLSEMNGIEKLQNVSIVAATNRPDMIDKALLSAGRFDRILYVSPPDFGARREIFAMSLKNIPHSADATPEALASLTHGYSGAEVSSITREASLRALEEDLNATEVTLAHFQTAIAAVKPAITPEMLRFYQHWKEMSGKQSI